MFKINSVMHWSASYILLEFMYNKLLIGNFYFSFDDWRVILLGSDIV